LSNFENYLNGLLSQIKDSIKIIEELKDNSGDLEIIKKRIGKNKWIITGDCKQTQFN